MTYTLQMKYVTITDGTLVLARYGDGSTALQITDHEGTETLSTNLGAYGLTPTDQREFYAKDYSEHEGLAGALILANIADAVGKVEFGPYGTTATLMRLRDEAFEGASRY